MTPIISHLYRFCAIRPRNKGFRVSLLSPPNSKNHQRHLWPSARQCSVEVSKPSSCRVKCTDVDWAVGITSRLFSGFAEHLCPCVMLTSLVVRSSALNMLPLLTVIFCRRRPPFNLPVPLCEVIFPGKENLKSFFKQKNVV